MKVIALDFDDCIFPSEGTYAGRTDDAIDLLKINLKRLKLILDKYKAKVFITSSWSSILTLNQFGEIQMKDRGLQVPLTTKPYYQLENQAFCQLKLYLDGYVIGLSEGNRENDIETLKKDNSVVIIDDWDLSNLQDKNCLYCRTVGHIDNHIIYNIHNFWKD